MTISSLVIPLDFDSLQKDTSLFRDSSLRSEWSTHRQTTLNEVKSLEADGTIQVIEESRGCLYNLSKRIV